jgi:hypothetical protein
MDNKTPKGEDPIAERIKDTIGCFRGSTSLPDLGEITKKYDLRRKERIQCRKEQNFQGNTSLEKFNPSHDKVEESVQQESLLSIIFKNEKKIERKLRSKSRLDSLFELCPMSPWRETSCLKTTADENEILSNLDFTNFYPSILISKEFPDPKDLWHIYCKYIPQEPGLVRVVLHTKKGIEPHVKEHHPFQLQIDKISCPFYLEGGLKIETLIHTNEAKIYEKFFDIEPIEAIVSNKAITHPLKNRVVDALAKIEELKKDREKNSEEIGVLKLIVNSATTTPKINQPKDLPSKFGVHCLSSQIVSNARAILFETVHKCLGPNDKLLQVNTDGFIVKTTKDNPVEQRLAQASLWGNAPGKIREKCKAQRGLFLGANTWWLINRDGKLVDEAGTGRPKISPQQIAQYKTIPKYLEYIGPDNQPKRINLLYLADFRHKLNHKSLNRNKFVLSEEGIHTIDAPWQITHKEKTRSWIVTKMTMNNFIKEFKKLNSD